MSEEEKRKQYLDLIKKRAKEAPEIRRISEDTESHKVDLSKDPAPNKDKKRE